MGSTNDYLVQIGHRTALEMKLALARHLLKRFPSSYDKATASYLSPAIVNAIFNEIPEKPEARAFLERNRETVDWWARSISSNKDLCELITGAVYSLCYARHIESGGKTSWWKNPYLGYVRALGRSITDFSYTDIASQMGEELDDRVVDPLINLLVLGIFEPLPPNPDSQEIYTRVHAFAVKVGVQFGGETTV